MRPSIPAVALLASLVVPVAAGAGDIEGLRAEYASSFTDPLTHLRLAREHQRAGRSLLAFSLLENLRRQSPAAFRATFSSVFIAGDADVDDATLERLLSEQAQRPDDVALADRVGRILLARGELEGAGLLFTQCAGLEPDERRHVENLADVLGRQRLNKRGEELLSAFDAEHPGGVQARTFAVQAALDATDVARAKRLVKEALLGHPDDCELIALRGQIFAAEGKGPEAQRYLAQAVRLCPERARLHGSYASFLMLVKGDPVQALGRYLEAYFVDPNFHDGTYVDARIRSLSASLAEALVARRDGACIDAACLAGLLADENPAIVRLALERAQSTWGSELEKPLLRLLGHDDPDLRAGAMLLLAQHADASFPARLEALFGSTDPRRLGMAAQLAVRTQGAAGRKQAKALLEHADELVRFDAITALGLEGGPSGRVIVAEHAEAEKSQQLRELAFSLGDDGS